MTAIEPGEEEDSTGADGIRLGTPVELPWWTVPLGIPPLLALLGGAVVPRGGPAGRLCAVVASALMLWVLYLVATRLRSRNMQSVWISASYALWTFAVLIWLALLFA